MQTVRPFLTFDGDAEAAMNLYCSVVPNSRITSIFRSESDGPIARGKVFHATFELDGREYAAMDGGSTFHFSEGFSLFLGCDDQEQVDRAWEMLTANGGKPGSCGWVTDPYGVSWQIVPHVLGELISDSEHGNSAAALEAMLKMSKLDIAALRAAYAEPVKAGA